MDLNDCYRLDWMYTPPSFLEAPLVVNGAGYELRFEDGHGHAHIEPAAYPDDNSLRSQLQHELIARFLAVQALTHKCFTLSNSRVTRIQPGGNQTFAFIEATLAVKIDAGQIDMVLSDAAGNIIRDTKAERIQATAEFMRLAAKHAPTDETADFILRSYSAAVNDPASEFIHLYQVSDALKKRFGDRAAAQNKLGVSEANWNRLHKIANDEPHNQGRHRGSMVGKLKDADAQVKQEARDIARDLIERYLRFIDSL
jgi:hypothetical protein